MIPVIHKPRLGFLSVQSVLRHLCVLTYAVEPARLRRYIPAPLTLETILGADGQTQALLSAVTFLNQNFHFSYCPWPKQRFGQTNYRVYVRRGDTRGVWFLGTRLGSYAYKIPRALWGMPWHHGRYHFDTAQNTSDPRSPYTRLHVEVSCDGRSVQRLTVRDTGQPAAALPGFATRDQALNTLTQPADGYYAWRRKTTPLKPEKTTQTGLYSVWHDLYDPRIGVLEGAHDQYLEDLDIVGRADQLKPHSVLIEPRIPYIIYLPPKVVKDL